MKRPDRPAVLEAALDADGRIRGLVAGFRAQLTQIVLRAQAATIAELQRQLVLTQDGEIARGNAGNQAAMRRTRRIFLDQLQRAGYGNSLAALTNSYDGLFPAFEATLNAITANWQKQPPPIDWTATDLRLLVRRQMNTRAELQQAVEALASEAQQKALFSTGALRFSELTAIIARHTGKSIPQASSIAATATTTFYRTMADRGFLQVERSLPSEVVRYTYEGPRDLLTRPFCKRVLASDKAHSRAEIAAMEGWEGHSLPNVMQTGGGYACRHQWLLLDSRTVSDDGAQRRPPGREERPPARRIRMAAAARIRERLLATDAQGRLRLEEVERRLQSQQGQLDLLPRFSTRRRQLQSETNALAAERQRLAGNRLTELHQILFAEQPSQMKALFYPGVETERTRNGWQHGVEFFRSVLGPALNEETIRIYPRPGILRAKYNLQHGILLDPLVSSPATLVHELGHFLEHRVAEVARLAQEFLLRRTTAPDGTREPLVPIGRLAGSLTGYEPDEVTRPDRFRNAYIGRHYATRNAGGEETVYATEVVSMGLEYLYADPVAFARDDPDHFDTIWTALSNARQSRTRRR